MPAARWIDKLSPGGTLVFPLGTPPGRARGEARRHSGHGAVLAFTRTAAGIAVRHLTPCAFVCAEGSLAGTPALQEASTAPSSAAASSSSAATAARRRPARSAAGSGRPTGRSPTTRLPVGAHGVPMTSWASSPRSSR